MAAPLTVLRASCSSQNLVNGCRNLLLRNVQPKLLTPTSTRTYQTIKTKSVLFNRSVWKRSVFIAGGLSFVTYVGYKTWLFRSVTLTADESGRPPAKPIRKVRRDSDNAGLKLTLYQYQTCPFCCKVRSFLDYHGFSYDVVEVNSVWRTEVKWSKYKKVPLLVVEGIGEEGYLPIGDSTVIISMLQSYLEDKSQRMDQLAAYYPILESKNEKGKTVREVPNKYFIMYGEKKVVAATLEEQKLERKWRKWADDHMVHMISPNVYRTPKESLEAFYYFSDAAQWEKVFSTFERYCVIYVGATAMYFIGKMLKRKYKLKEDVRESMYESCREWTQAVGKKQPFMGGNTPNLADLAVYGVLLSMEGCGAFDDILSNTDIGGWYHRTKKAIGANHGTVAAHMAVQ